jgi:hypothetical protein
MASTIKQPRTCATLAACSSLQQQQQQQPAAASGTAELHVQVWQALGLHVSLLPAASSQLAKTSTMAIPGFRSTYEAEVITILDVAVMTYLEDTCFPRLDRCQATFPSPQQLAWMHRQLLARFRVLLAVLLQRCSSGTGGTESSSSSSSSGSSSSSRPRGRITWKVPWQLFGVRGAAEAIKA